MTEGKLSHEEVQAIADKVSADFKKLVTRVIANM